MSNGFLPRIRRLVESGSIDAAARRPDRLAAGSLRPVHRQTQARRLGQ
ncbi:hypothetical protein [Burkholderia gladioli]|nr:hypothetical protein [Burkholderia gladioli]MBU9188440.1 hypothetical protein [Burkholderia gladioli]MBU9270665.1 hypothetical protein [Burkholderia gladioli]